MKTAAQGEQIMFNSIRIAAAIVALVAVISISAFFYLTREIAAPSQDVQESVVQLEMSDTSGSEVVGDALEFQVTGDLTINGMTQAITFNVTATLETADQLVGTAETTVNYADFNLSIPDVPFVASVQDSVVLSLDFVANAVDTATAA
jgi:YceI-like domain